MLLLLHFPFYLSWSDGAKCHILVFWMFSFKPAFSLSSFILIKRLFSSSLLSTIWVISSVDLKLLIFLLTILIPAFDSSSSAFHMMHSSCKLNKQCDNTQPCQTPMLKAYLQHLLLCCMSCLALTKKIARYTKRQKTVWRDKTSIRTGHNRDAGMIMPRI